MEYSRIWQSDTVKGIELLRASFQQFEFSKHWHDELAIGVIEHGAEGLHYRGNNIIIPENQIVAINPSEVHTGFAGCDSGWSYRMFYFDPQMIRAHFELEEQHVPPLINAPIIDDPSLFQLLQQLHMALEQPSFDITKESLLTVAFEGLFGRHGSKKTNNKIYKEQKNNALVRDYLLQHWQDNVSLEALEALTGLSKYKLIRSFNAQYGVTPHQFLLLIKINQAKRLLQSGQNCADTALSCGFFDQSHLTRNFKRAFGIAPKRYSACSAP
ncbi:AraC family transcriptional regulator [Vibrio sp. MACH09]|uniref:AraC family transcriptional regulator n=1 Tax=unclassified Vibrio TaxID=2614977 RepID=UPI0014935A77|nr:MULTISPECIES: AraC family transcriptional regulator [unclassified Vibrio]NOI67527.1 AraC family transcriptional regulator [Vibrio sp. 99-8-1]GLO63846.1 AraC family transcriptional regulator [Vibrio sp. MACH09]